MRGRARQAAREVRRGVERDTRRGSEGQTRSDLRQNVHTHTHTHTHTLAVLLYTCVALHLPDRAPAKDPFDGPPVFGPYNRSWLLPLSLTPTQV